MHPYNDAENAWLSETSQTKTTLDPSWLSQTQVDLQIRRAEQMRSDAIHHTYCKARAAIAKKASSVWRSLRGQAQPETGATV